MPYAADVYRMYFRTSCDCSSYDFLFTCLHSTELHTFSPKPFLFPKAAVVAPSCAKWEFEVAIYRFSNPNNEDSTNNCCSASCNPCAHYFTFCLRDKNSGGYSCPRGAYVTPTTPGRTLDATTVTFTPGSGQMFGPTGVLNPLLYCGNQWTVSKFVELPNYKYSSCMKLA